MRERLRQLQPDLALCLLLFLVPLAFFWQQTLGGRTLLPLDNLFQYEPYASLKDDYGVGIPQNALLSDLILQNAVWKQFAIERILNNDLPLWQNNIVAGAPFLAAGQSSVLYPFSALFLIIPLPAAFGWFTVSQLWIAGLNMYLLMRVLGIRRPGALVAALVYQLSGFSLVSVVFPMIIATMCWLPLELAMIELVIRQGKALGGRPASLPWAAVGGLGLGIAGLAGHPEALYFTLLVMAYYALFRLLAGLIAARQAPGLWGKLFRRSAWLLGLVALGLAVGAVQTIPAAELVSRSFREGAEPYRQIVSYAYPPRHILAFLMPNFYGNPSHHAILDVFTGRWMPVEKNALGEAINHTHWGIKNYVEGGAYVGLLPMAFAAIAALHWLAGRSGRVDKHVGGEVAGAPYRFIFGSLGLFSLTFVFGLPTYAVLFYGLPFINQSHSPFRWVWPLTLCIAVLAGFGAEIVQGIWRPLPAVETTNRPPDSFARRRVLWMAQTLLGAGLMLTICLLLSRLFYGALEGLVERIFRELALAPNAFPDGKVFYSYQFWNGAWLAVAAVMAGSVLLVSRGALEVPEKGWLPFIGRRPLWEPLAAIVIILDLMVPLIGFHPSADPAWFRLVPESIEWMQSRQSDQAPWRFIVYEEPGADTMNANIGWLHGLEDAAGYDSLIPGLYAEYMEVIHPQGDLAYNRIAPIYTFAPSSLDSPLLDLLNIRYVVTEQTIESAKYELAYQDESLSIYENLGAMPRTFTLPASATVFYNEPFAEISRRYDVRQHVLVSIGFEPQPPLPVIENPREVAGQANPATITVYTPHETWVDVQVEEQSWLVLSESYYPGWRAFVRPFGSNEDSEQETPVYLVNGNFRGLLLSPGVWTVRIRYSPDSVRLGGFISFISFMSLLFFLGVWVWRYAYQDSPQESDIRRIAKNSITPIILNLFNRGIQFAFAVVYLRILGPEGSGRYQYAVLIFGWFEILSNFGLDTLLMREVSRNREAANRWFVNTSLMRLAIAVLGVPVLAGFIGIRQAALAQPLATETITAIWLLYAGLFIATLNKGFTGLFYAFEKAEYPSALQTVSTILVATLGVIVLVLRWGIVGLAAVSIVVNVITFAALYLLTRRLLFSPHIDVDWGLQRGAAGESFPLMINHLLATLFFRIDIVLLEALTTDRIVGWYGVVYKWIDAINVIPSFFTQALFPVMSRQAAEDKAALKRSYIFAVKALTFISVPTAVATTLMAEFLIGLVGGPQFLPWGALALQIFVWSIPIGWINSVTNYLIIALNRQRTLTWAFIFGAVFNIVGNLFTIPRYSFPAAAVMTILSEFVLLAFFYLVMLEPLGRIPWLHVLGRLLLCGAAMAVTAYGLAGYSIWMALVASIGIYGVAAIVLRPFDSEERKRLISLLPVRVQAAMKVYLRVNNG